MAKILEPAFRPNYRDIVSALRLLADEIECGDEKYHTVILVGVSETEIGIHGLGARTENMESLGILARGIHVLNNLMD